MSKNPFGNLNINRDDDDDEDYVKVTRKNSISASNHTSNTEMKKKKKVRPEEKVQQEAPAQVSEGFEVVGKVKKTPYTVKNLEEEGAEVKKDFKKEKFSKGTGNKDRVYNKNRPEKRQYEKHSGTGRGRETAKNGAGGKTVWGDNPEQIAREGKKRYGNEVDQCKFTFFFHFTKNIYKFLNFFIYKNKSVAFLKLIFLTINKIFSVRICLKPQS